GKMLKRFYVWPQADTAQRDHQRVTGRSGVGQMSSDVAPTRGAGAGLRAQRERLLLTQEELAARSGVDVRTIRDIETGWTARPRPSPARLLAAALTGPQKEAAPAPRRSTSRPPAPCRPTCRTSPAGSPSWACSTPCWTVASPPRWSSRPSPAPQASVSRN